MWENQLCGSAVHKHSSVEGGMAKMTGRQVALEALRFKHIPPGIAV